MEVVDREHGLVEERYGYRHAPVRHASRNLLKQGVLWNKATHVGYRRTAFSLSLLAFASRRRNNLSFPAEGNVGVSLSVSVSDSLSVPIASSLNAGCRSALAGASSLFSPFKSSTDKRAIC